MVGGAHESHTVALVGIKYLGKIPRKDIFVSISRTADIFLSHPTFQTYVQMAGETKTTQLILKSVKNEII